MRIAKIGSGLVVVAMVVLGTASVASAQTTATAIAASAGSEFSLVGIAVIAALVVPAVALILARNALPWAARMFHLSRS